MPGIHIAQHTSVVRLSLLPLAATGVTHIITLVMITLRAALKSGFPASLPWWQGMYLAALLLGVKAVAQ